MTAMIKIEMENGDLFFFYPANVSTVFHNTVRREVILTLRNREKMVLTPEEARPLSDFLKVSCQRTAAMLEQSGEDW
jgi:hypothetical protein